jgi:hypothetical protein
LKLSGGGCNNQRLLGCKGDHNDYRRGWMG